MEWQDRKGNGVLRCRYCLEVRTWSSDNATDAISDERFVEKLECYGLTDPRCDEMRKQDCGETTQGRLDGAFDMIAVW